MIPCLRNKCICLPVCKGKDYIECLELSEYFNVLKIKFGRTTPECWRCIRIHLPNLDSIQEVTISNSPIQHNKGRVNVVRSYTAFMRPKDE